MNMNELCNGMSAELAGWRSRMYGIIGHVETLPELDRRHFSTDINALRAIISEVEESIRQLRSECPTEL